MPAKSILSRIGDEIIDAHEQVASRIMETVSTLSSAAGDGGGGGPAGGAAGVPPPHEFEIDGDGGEGIDIDDGMMEGGSPLEGIAEHVMGDIFQGQSGPQTPWEHIDAFRSAINWTEPLLISLIGFQVVVFLATILVIRRGGTVSRFGLLAFVAILIRCAERLNAYGANHWEGIATQNYFDKQGIFVMIMLCLPLLGDCVLMLYSFMREASSLLVEVKQMELKKKAKGAKKQDGGKGKATSGAKERRGKKKAAKED